ncbi:MAG: lactate utilization protein [Halanaerobiales bacterium]|nr:lactate utilization protein [Halanaerobiales bacterium]
MNKINYQNIEYIIKKFEKRNIQASYFENLLETKNKILNMIPMQSSIGIGNSKTLKKMEISKELSERGNQVLDKTKAKTKEEVLMLKRKSLLTDWYITGTNAISMEGHIVNIDHSGNRVAAMLYGPKKVIIVVGINKITKTLEKAVNRIKNIAAPLNAKRAGFEPPCIEVNKCIDCFSDERVCNSLVTIEGQADKNRIKVFIVNQRIGF